MGTKEYLGGGHGGVEKCITYFRKKMCREEALGRPRRRWYSYIKMVLI
jgi:hypothetical protein